MNKQMTAIIEREGDGYVSFCPELDIASQGDTVQETRENRGKCWNCFSKPHRRKKFSSAVANNQNKPAPFEG